MARVQHFVAFKYKPETTAEQRQKVRDDFLSLPDRCKHEGRKYTSIVGGANCANFADFHKGMHDAFLMVFETAAQRDFYDKEDPAHDEFRNSVIPHLADVVIVDFEEGKW